MTRATRSRSMLRRLGEVVAILAVSAVLLGVVEGVLRVARLVSGEPATTRAERFDREIRRAATYYRLHPYLNTAAREATRVEVFGKVATSNALGYRSPERPVDAPKGQRILCAGGSTTFDIGVTDDAATWPWRLETELANDGHTVEVWNAGFPGWTSLENLLSLAQRDARLRPSLMILYQGINDLQPAAHRPYDPGYERGHAEIARQALGLELRPLPWSERSLVLERARDLLGGEEDDPWDRLVAPQSDTPRLRELPDAAIETFRRNVRSIAGLARVHEIRLLLVSQPLRPTASPDGVGDDYLAGWLPGLEPDAAPAQLERLNRVLEDEAAALETLFWDAAALPWTDEHFTDPMHFSDAGSRFFAEQLADELSRFEVFGAETATVDP